MNAEQGILWFKTGYTLDDDRLLLLMMIIIEANKQTAEPNRTNKQATQTTNKKPRKI